METGEGDGEGDEGYREDSDFLSHPFPGQGQVLQHIRLASRRERRERRERYFVNYPASVSISERRLTLE